ncbi:MAG: TonB-dependent receptor [Candidatus Competibacteraceae bacterium]|nr:TonB-dependent receptor [Candidatus Competibacteraceae bacterium]
MMSLFTGFMLANAAETAWGWDGDPPFGARTLDEVVVTAPRAASQPLNAVTLGADALDLRRHATSDTADLLRNVPGIGLQSAGGISSLPVIHGLADDRVRTQVDGMNLMAACPNHMNPALSYIDPSQIGQIDVHAGITPVSVGGDSLGGTIQIESAVPEFAAPGQGNLISGQVGAFYRGNGNVLGAYLGTRWANEKLNLSYTGSTVSADNYKAGGDFKASGPAANGRGWLAGDVVGSSAFEASNQSLGIAYRDNTQLFTAKVDIQNVPYEGFPNQRMDMTENKNALVNLGYTGQHAWGLLTARAYYQKTRHKMQFGDDKQYDYGDPPTIPGMPMDTKADMAGFLMSADIDLASGDILRVGGEYQYYRLDDWWPPSGGGMAPNTFENINNGQRDRYALFGEWEGHLDPRWISLFGVRHETIKMNTGDVHGYAETNGMGMMVNNQLIDSSTFNSQDHNKTDQNWDLTALLRYTPDPNQDYEFGLARKTRSPNLYERYTWSTWAMAAIMNNFVGDGNGYIGNLDLEPEIAHTVSFTLDWHSQDRSWVFKATPYYTRVTDYIDAVRCGDGAACTATNATTTDQFVVLQYVNQPARLYGIDLYGQMPLADTDWGRFGLNGVVNYTNGENLDTNDGLYNVMPLNATLILTHRHGGWDNALEWVLAHRKNDISEVRNEIRTPGYGLLNLRGSYSWKQARVDFGIENLFDKLYYLPTGGAYTGQGQTMAINGIPWGIAVPGRGRSFYTAVNFKF